MDTCKEFKFLKDFGKGLFVEEIDFTENNLFGFIGEICDTTKGFFGGVVEIVDYHCGIASIDELEYSVGSNVAGAAGYENGFVSGSR